MQGFVSWLTGASTAPKSAKVRDAEAAFTREELNALCTRFKAASGAPNKVAAPLPKQPFSQRLCGLPGTPDGERAATALFQVCSGLAGDPHSAQGGGVSYDDYIVAKATCDGHLGADAALDFGFSVLCALCGAQPPAAIPPAALEEGTSVACALLAAASPTASGAPPEGAAAWAAPVARGALWAAAGPAAQAPAPSLDAAGYARWARMCPAWQALLTGLLTSHVAVVKEVVAHPKLGPSPALLGHQAGLLLHPLAARMLAACMPTAHRAEWRLLFNSDGGGKSFNTMMGKLGSVEGATLLLVQEAGEEGHLIAGYAPAPWRKSGTYFGESTAWVARLLPIFQVFQASGANKNYQWCGQGFSQLPNGLGFGGAQSAPTFALLVDDTLDTGQSRPTATFGSPSLTRQQAFEVSAVECWLVQPPEEEDEASTSSKSKAGGSALDKAGADRLIQSWAGREVNHSAGLRDEPLEE